MRHLWAALFVFGAGLASHTALAMNGDDDVVFAEASILSGDEMAELRAGFFDIGGLIYRFAVDIRTEIDGALTFVRTVALDQSGKGFEASSSSSLTQNNLPASTQSLVVNNGGGLVVTNANGGSTTILNQNGNGAPTSIILNTADNANISQTINIDLTLQNIGMIFQTLGGGPANLANTLLQNGNMQSVGFGF